MDELKVIVWNMHQKRGNWSCLKSGADLEAAIHLLCEAPRPPRHMEAVGQWRTIGLDDALPLDKPVKREWSTAVASSLHRVTYITDARTDRVYEVPQPLPFKPSRPGTWTAAQVEVGGRLITAIAVYGLMDEWSDASVHRSLSELSPIFDHEDYNKFVVLGGDLNIYANPGPQTPYRRRMIAVVDRINAYGLTDCLTGLRPERLDGLVDCLCGDAECKTHWRTFRRSSEAPGKAIQEDYLFASEAMISHPYECEALGFDHDSDHAPIQATFQI